jgi:Domain of Unknown Function with PDB structure (DUF3857)
MKRVVSSLLCTVLIPCLVAAQDFPTVGYISDAEFTLKECAFDKEAAAVVLVDEAVANYNDDYNLITDRHIRIKILKESGFKYANIEIPFYRKSRLESVERIEGTVTNLTPEGKQEVTALEKKSIYKKEMNEFWGRMIFTFPNIKVGSIIEYTYRKFSDSYSFLDDWKFHDYLPVVKSAFSLYVPPRLEFAYQVIKQTQYPITITQEQSSAKVYFEMNNLPGLDDESYMDARKDYIQRATFQLSGVNSFYSGFRKTNTTWKEVINDFTSSSSFGTQLRKNLAGAGEFIDAVKKLSTDEEKMKAVYDYVRTSMSWNGFNSRYAGNGVKEAWSKKSGTNGEINLILVNLLQDAGLDAYPLLVSERWHGKVNTEYPFIDQFNTVYAYVIINEKKYYLDGTDKFTPAGFIPKDILNTTALMVNRKNGGIITITNDDLIFSEYVNTIINIDPAGKVSGETGIKSDGYARIDKLAALKEDGEEKFISRFLKNDDFTITDFKFLNKDNDSLPAKQEFKFSGQLTPSGDYLFLPLNYFTGFTKNPFFNQKRFSDINFGYKRKISSYTTIQLPPGFVPETLPKLVKMTTPDNDISFNRSVEYNKEANSVDCIFVIDFKKSLYNYEDYEILQQVYKKMFDFLKEPLVLKKK